jgi:uncharacterized membrane protein
VLSANAVVDRVVDAFQAQRADMQLIQSNLSNEQEAKLREAFGEVPVQAIQMIGHWVAVERVHA